VEPPQPTKTKVKAEPLSPKVVDDDLKKAAGKITLMSPEAFSTQLIKKEIVVKAEPTQEEDEDDEEVEHLTVNAAATASGMATKSGGSSPSREVRDILGDSEEQGGLGAEIVVTEEPYDDDEDDDDLVNVGEDDDDDEIEVKPRLADADVLASGMDILSVTDPGPLPPTPSAPFMNLSSTGGWPAAPPVKVEPKQEQHRRYNGGEDAASSDAILRELSKMTQLIMYQQNELRALREEVKILKTEASSQQQSQQQLLDKYVKRSGQQLNDALKRDAKQKTEAVVAGVAAAIKTEGVGDLRERFGQELKRVAPSLAAELSRSATALFESEMKARSGRMDSTLRETVTRVVNGKHLQDQLAPAVAGQMQQALQNQLRDVMCQTLVPAMERAMSNLLQQISGKLIQGVKEHEEQVQVYMAKMKQEALASLKDPLAALIREQMSQMAKLNESQMQKIVSSVGEAAAEELRHLAGQAGASSASPGGRGTVPPSPLSRIGNQQPSLEEMKQRIRAHLSSGRIADAFSAALSANSLALVEATCEMVNPAAVFGGPSGSVLPQPVLLALVQQLGHDLDSKTELKLSYLEDSLMALDAGDPAVRQHLPAILQGLKKQLTRQLVSTEGNSQLRKQIKMLSLAIVSLLNDAAN